WTAQPIGNRLTGGPSISAVRFGCCAVGCTGWGLESAAGRASAAWFCQCGRAVAPRPSVLVARNAQEARARARLGRRGGTIAAIRRAEDVIGHSPRYEMRR